MNKNKKRLIILLLLLQSYNFTFAGNLSHEVEKEDEIRIELREEVRQNNQLNNKVIVSKKKQLKKEIQRRKKFHKNLLSMYNKTFDEKILKNISDNGLLITNLENEYNKFKFLKI